MANYQKTEKRHIAPVTFTVKVTATKVNEKGTLMGLTDAEVVEAPKGLDNPRVFKVNFGHTGQLLLMVDSLKGLKVISEEEKASKARTERPKLF